MTHLERIGFTLNQQYAIHNLFWSGLSPYEKRQRETTNWKSGLFVITRDHIPPRQKEWYYDAMFMITSRLTNLLEIIIVVNNEWMLRATRKTASDRIARGDPVWVKIGPRELLAFPFTTHSGHLSTRGTDITRRFNVDI